MGNLLRTARMLLAFTPAIYTDSREFVAPDGRRWCARSYLARDWPIRPTPGKTYTPQELVRLYGLVTRDGEPGLFLYPDEEMPREVLYVVEPISSGEE